MRIAIVRAGGAMLLAGGLAACGAHHRTVRHLRRHPAPAPSRLVGVHPCPGVAGFTCAFLSVPLDHAGQAAGSLRLAVGMQDVARPARGVLLFLTGGPGQPGIPFIRRVRSRLGRALTGYRLVMFDQRGTGAGALRCPALQAGAGASDLAVVPAREITACAQGIGAERRYFTTPETVADVEALRAALGAPRLTIDGVSYGTYVAERYALAHPGRVARLLLDSVVPQGGVDPLYLAALQATPRVLRDACRAARCSWDPARDVRVVVAREGNGPQLLDALVAESVAFPSFGDLLGPLHAAAAGQPQALRRVLAAIRRADGVPAGVLSQGLHESTLCLDLPPSWNPDATTQARTERLQREAASAPPVIFGPFDRATAFGNGLVQGCLDWPPTPLPAVADGDPDASLPPVPVLLLAGERDLSTPLAWAQAEAAKAPDGRLVLAPGAGHSVQTRDSDPAVRRAVITFLSG